MFPGIYQEQEKDDRKSSPLNHKGKLIIHDSQRSGFYAYLKNLCLYKEERKTNMNHKRQLERQEISKTKAKHKENNCLNKITVRIILCVYCLTNKN
jgi:hypothetical protein